MKLALLCGSLLALQSHGNPTFQLHTLHPESFVFHICKTLIQRKYVRVELIFNTYFWESQVSTWPTHMKQPCGRAYRVCIIPDFHRKSHMPGFLIDSHNCTIGQCDNIEAAIEKFMEINLLYSEVKGDSVA